MDKLKVLVVDDMRTARNFIKSGLEGNHNNIQVIEVNNGREAKAKLELDRYDLILCDWEMPVMTGAELLTWVRDHNTLKDIKFIMITARTDRGSVIQALQMGVNGYLVKPFTIDKLLIKMTEVDNRFSRRKHERVTVDDGIVLHYGEQSINGKLLDISVGGLLAIFSIKSGLPQILDKTSIDVGSTGVKQVSGIPGFVIRIQAAEAFPNSEYIKIAIKFLGVDSQKTNDLQTFINDAMQSRTPFDQPDREE